MNGKRVVDVGCGGGILADSMARRGAEVLGIDLAIKPLRVAQLHAIEAGTPRIEYREVAVEALAAEQPEAFDVVTCMEMLEHVPDPGSIVSACGRLLKPGGWAFFSTINRNAKAFAFAIVGAEHVLSLLPKGTHEYAKFIRPSELAGWCRGAAPRPRGHPRHGIQPAEPALPPFRRHERQLPRRLSQARMTPAAPGTRPAAILFDLDGTLIDSAPDLAGACNDMRIERGLAALPYERLRAMVGSGARGMVGVGFGLAPDDAGYLDLRDEFLRRYEARMTLETRVFVDVPPLLARLAEEGIAWGIVTNKATRFAAPLVAALGLADVRGHARLRRHDGALQASSRAPARGGAAARRARRRPASTSATTGATSMPAGRRGCAPSSPPGAISAPATRRPPGRPTPSSPPLASSWRSSRTALDIRARALN